MKYLLPIVLLLSACGGVPIVPKFPEPPGKSAMQACPGLQKLKDGPVLSEVSKTISDNYGEYYACAVKSDLWIEWYQIQKKIYEDLK